MNQESFLVQGSVCLQHPQLVRRFLGSLCGRRRPRRESAAQLGEGEAHPLPRLTHQGGDVSERGGAHCRAHLLPAHLVMVEEVLLKFVHLRVLEAHGL